MSFTTTKDAYYLLNLLLNPVRKELTSLHHLAISLGFGSNLFAILLAVSLPMSFLFGRIHLGASLTDNSRFAHCAS